MNSIILRDCARAGFFAVFERYPAMICRYAMKSVVVHAQEHAVLGGVVVGDTAVGRLDHLARPRTPQRQRRHNPFTARPVPVRRLRHGVFSISQDRYLEDEGGAIHGNEEG